MQAKSVKQSTSPDKRRRKKQEMFEREREEICACKNFHIYDDTHRCSGIIGTCSETKWMRALFVCFDVVYMRLCALVTSVLLIPCAECWHQIVLSRVRISTRILTLSSCRFRTVAKPKIKSEGKSACTRDRWLYMVFIISLMCVKYEQVCVFCVFCMFYVCVGRCDSFRFFWQWQLNNETLDYLFVRIVLTWFLFFFCFFAAHRFASQSSLPFQLLAASISRDGRSCTHRIANLMK